MKIALPPDAVAKARDEHEARLQGFVAGYRLAFSDLIAVRKEQKQEAPDGNQHGDTAGEPPAAG